MEIQQSLGHPCVFSNIDVPRFAFCFELCYHLKIFSKERILVTPYIDFSDEVKTFA